MAKEELLEFPGTVTELPAALDAFILQMLTKDHRRRPAAAEVAVRLRAMGSGATPAAACAEPAAARSAISFSSRARAAARCRSFI